MVNCMFSYNHIVCSMNFRAKLRRKCWELGAFTSLTPSELGSTHFLLGRNPEGDSREKAECRSFETRSCASVDLRWLFECHERTEYVDEGSFVRANIPIVTSFEALQTNRKPLAASHVRSDSDIGVDRTKNDRQRIAYRRSDVSTVPLRPDGLFRGLSLSLYGWSDHRLESSLIHQITSNGGSIVPVNSMNQYACICSDGHFPITNIFHGKLVSQRWLNECLESSQVLDPESKALFSPSMSQLPLLVTRKICLYISEKDQVKFDEISAISKVCGLKHVSRSDTRIPLSTVTHFIFYDIASANRRRDLIPVATKANKFVVSFEWLAASFRTGSIQDESSYDLSNVLNQPALTDLNTEPSKLTQSPFLNYCIVVDPHQEHMRALVTALGADLIISQDEVSTHVCQHRFYVSDRPERCKCPTVTESWLLECHRQKRIVPLAATEADRVQTPSVPDKAGANQVDIHWENTKLDLLKNDMISS